MPSLEVITGPMSCGKTEELIRRLRRANYAKKEVLLFKPAIDTRDGESAKSRNGISFPAFSVDSAAALLEHCSQIRYRVDVIGIEEAQFFDDQLPEVVERLVSVACKRVIVSGLNTDFRGKPFGPMPTLLAMADEIQTLTAICMGCGSDMGTRTQRMINDLPARYDSPLILIGGDQTYEARCRGCHHVPGSPTMGA